MKYPETIRTGLYQKIKNKRIFIKNNNNRFFYNQIKTLYDNIIHAGIVCIIPFFQKLISNGNGYEAATRICNTGQIRELS